MTIKQLKAEWKKVQELDNKEFILGFLRGEFAVRHMDKLLAVAEAAQDSRKNFEIWAMDYNVAERITDALDDLLGENPE